MVEGNFKEKWYLSNITIGLVLFICSMVPFASILGIPLVVLIFWGKSKGKTTSTVKKAHSNKPVNEFKRIEK